MPGHHSKCNLSNLDCNSRLNYFEEVTKKCATLGDELWLRGFVTRFLGELIFTHGQTTVAIEVAEIVLTVVTGKSIWHLPS